MQTLDRSLRGIVDTIPVPWPQLEARIKPGPGHLVLVIGAPGVGKSAFGLVWALRCGEPTLLLSLDSDLATQAARTVSALSGVPFSKIREQPEVWEAFLVQQRDRLPMVMDYPVTPEDMESVFRAFEEYYGQMPRLVVIDNLKDIVVSKDYAAYDEAVRELHRIARRCKVTFVLLHHIRKDRDMTIWTRPDQADALFAGNQDSEFVLGLYRSWAPGVGPALMVGILKNRFGPTGENVPLYFDMERMIIG